MMSFHKCNDDASADMQRQLNISRNDICLLSEEKSFRLSMCMLFGLILWNLLFETTLK